MEYLKTKDILEIFKEKYKNKDFRTIGNNVQQSNTIEIQNAHFIADKDWIVREPNYNYFKRELEWYLSQSLNVNDIPGGAPTMWKACADKYGYVNSNYGWVIFNPQNEYQYDSCKDRLIADPHTREAIMIYNRPSMQNECCLNGMHDFMCCQNVQYFINERNENLYLDCIVNFRSCDAVFGYDNDYLFQKYVLNRLTRDIKHVGNTILLPGIIYWNAGSLHVYERHFKFLEDAKD